jgi:HlyD family secretion protein
VNWLSGIEVEHADIRPTEQRIGVRILWIQRKGLEADVLSVEAKLSPQDIDQLHLGQSAVLRFSGLNQRTTPEIYGVVGRISADISQDQRSGQSYYTVRINIDAAEAARLGQVKLVLGMPVETFMKTHDRTVFSYFTKPLQDQVLRAFRGR